jgi:hypothetical protein
MEPIRHPRKRCAATSGGLSLFATGVPQLSLQVMYSLPANAALSAERLKRALTAVIVLSATRGAYLQIA